MPETKDSKLCLILIVEDDPNILGMLRDILEVEGFRIATAQTGASALQSIRQSKPDLIVLDLVLPDMNGYQLIKTWQDSPTRDIPIVVITARAMETSTQDMIKMESNVKGFFAKPLQPYAFVLHLHDILKTTPRQSPPRT
ncbi:MAG: response regulator [Elusimicrobia bacterium]|nr:response regulator [Elusimicrobiota bacterium]